MEQKEDNLVIFKFVVTFVSIALFIFLCIVWLMPFTNQEQLMNSFFYFFSSTAQTMGALFAIVLSSIYVLMTTSANNNILSMPANRLLLRDNLLISSILFFVITIIMSIFGIFLTKVLDNPYFTKLVYLPFILSVIIIFSSICGLILLISFIFRRGIIYTNPEYLIINDIFHNEIPTPEKIDISKLDNTKIALYSEISILCFANGNNLRYYNYTSKILFNIQNKSNINLEMFQILHKYLILDLNQTNKNLAVLDSFYWKIIISIFNDFDFVQVIPYHCSLNQEQIVNKLKSNREIIITFLEDFISIIDPKYAYEVYHQFLIILNRNHLKFDLQKNRIFDIDLNNNLIVDYLEDIFKFIKFIMEYHHEIYDRRPNILLTKTIELISDRSLKITHELTSIKESISVIIFLNLIRFINYINQNLDCKSKENFSQLLSFKYQFEAFSAFFEENQKNIFIDKFIKQIYPAVDNNKNEYLLYIEILLDFYPQLQITEGSDYLVYLFENINVEDKNESIYNKIYKYLKKNIANSMTKSLKYGYLLNIELLKILFNNFKNKNYNIDDLYEIIISYFERHLPSDSEDFKFDKECFEIGRKLRLKELQSQNDI